MEPSTTSTETTPPVNSTHWHILLASLLGLVLGLLVYAYKTEMSGETQEQVLHLFLQLTSFIGQAFLRALRFISVPIVLFSLVAGIATLSDISKLGRIAYKSIVLYLSSTALAISIGLVLASLIKPGLQQNTAQSELLVENTASVQAKLQTMSHGNFLDTLLQIIPTNPFASLAEGNMLQIVFFAVCVGIGLTHLNKEKSNSTIQLFQHMTDVMIHITQWIMKVAPLAVFCLLFQVTSTIGLAAMRTLLWYAITVLLGLAIMLVVIYPIGVRWSNRSLVDFYKAVAPAQLLAFSSSSSSATMPITLHCTEHSLGIDKDISRFVIPLGATVNMDGTALYQGVAAIFICQLYGIDLDTTHQLQIILTATLASIGTAGVPGVGLIMLVIVLQSVGLSTEQMTGGLAIIFGVDRILDMARTVVNITGDCTVASVVHHWEEKTSTTSDVST